MRQGTERNKMWQFTTVFFCICTPHLLAHGHGFEVDRQLAFLRLEALDDASHVTCYHATDLAGPWRENLACTSADGMSRAGIVKYFRISGE